MDDYDDDDDDDIIINAASQTIPYMVHTVYREYHILHQQKNKCALRNVVELLNIQFTFGPWWTHGFTLDRHFKAAMALITIRGPTTGTHWNISSPQDQPQSDTGP